MAAVNLPVGHCISVCSGDYTHNCLIVRRKNVALLCLSSQVTVVAVAHQLPLALLSVNRVAADTPRHGQSAGSVP